MTSSTIDEMEGVGIAIPPRVGGVLLLLALVFLAALPSLAGTWLPGDRAYVGLRLPESGILLPPMPLAQWPQAPPAAAVVMVIERLGFGDMAAGYRVVSFVLHVGVALSLWLLLRRLGVAFAWLAAAVFALDPVQVGAMAIVQGQGVVLSGLLYIWAILLSLRGQQLDPSKRRRGAGIFAQIGQSRGAHFAAVLVLAIAASLASSLAASLPVTLTILLLWKGKRPGSRQVLELALIAVLSVGMAVLSELTTPGGWSSGHLSLGSQLTLPPRALAFYAQSILWPFGHALLYPEWYLNYVVQCFVLLGLIFIFVIAWLLDGPLGRGAKICILLFLVLSLPSAITGGLVVSDVMSYFATAATAVAIAGALDAITSKTLLTRRPVLAHAPAAALIVFLGLVFASRATIYAWPNLVWDQVLQEHPDLPAALLARATIELVDRQNFPAAEHDFRAVLEQEPTSGDAFLGLARIATVRHDFSAAVSDLYQGLAAAPEDVRLRNALAAIEEHQGETQSALDEYRKVLPIAPDDPVALDGVGRLQTALANYGDASAALERATDANPWFARAWASLATLRWRQGREDEVPALFDRGCDADPTSSEAWIASGLYYAEKGNLDQAVFRLRRAAATDRNSAQAYFQLAMVLDKLHDVNCVYCIFTAASLDKANTALLHQAQELQAKYFPARRPQTSGQ
jgi:tetratricopeptide (TPR) repeat protein